MRPRSHTEVRAWGKREDHKGAESMSRKRPLDSNDPRAPLPTPGTGVVTPRRETPRVQGAVMRYKGGAMRYHEGQKRLRLCRRPSLETVQRADGTVFLRELGNGGRGGETCS